MCYYYCAAFHYFILILLYNLLVYNSKCVKIIFILALFLGCQTSDIYIYIYDRFCFKRFYPVPHRKLVRIPKIFYFSFFDELFKSIFLEPWLVWLSGLNAGLWTKGSLAQFQVRAHAWAAGQVPSWRHMRGNHTLMFPSLSFSLLSPFSINK